MMWNTDNPGLPPPHLLEALRQPRQPQLHDEQVQQLLRTWRCLGRPITQEEFAQLVDLLVPRSEQRIQHIVKARAAVVSAGIEILYSPQGIVHRNPTFENVVGRWSQAEHAEVRRRMREHLNKMQVVQRKD